MADRQLTLAEMNAIESWMPLELTDKQITDVFKMAQAVADVAYREGWNVGVAQSRIRRNAIRDSEGTD